MIYKQSTPHSRQITTPTPHHLIFYRPDALPDAQPTMSKALKAKSTEGKYYGIYIIKMFSNVLK